MAQLYRHKQFRLYIDVRVADGEVRFSGGKTTDQMYSLRDKSGAAVDVALDYFTFLILVRNLKKVGSEAYAIVIPRFKQQLFVELMNRLR